MRIRSIKPDFWKSESIGRLSIPTRLTFIGLWNYVDDNGVGRDVDKLIVAELYPLEDDPARALACVRRALDELATRGRVTRYTVDGKAYFAITNWSEHQKIDRPGKPRYPGPEDPAAQPVTCTYEEDATPLDEPSSSPRRIVAEHSSQEQGAGSREQDQGEGASDKPIAPLRLDVEQVCQAVVAAELHKGNRKPTITEQWRTSARLLLDRDGRALADVLDVIEWTKDHDFWRANIKSVPKLREQFDTLRLQKQSERGRPNRDATGRPCPPGQESLEPFMRFREVNL